MLEPETSFDGMTGHNLDPLAHPNGIAGGGGTPDLSNYEGETISLTATGDDGILLSATGENGTVGIAAAVGINLGLDDMSVGIALGSFGLAFVNAQAPELPATPLPQDIADALVALGLVTQAT